MKSAKQFLKEREATFEKDVSETVNKLIQKTEDLALDQDEVSFILHTDLDPSFFNSPAFVKATLRSLISYFESHGWTVAIQPQNNRGTFIDIICYASCNPFKSIWYKCYNQFRLLVM